MKVVDRFNVTKPPEGPRKFSFEFTGPGLISVVVVGVLGIVWVFILGVLVGRGYKPENAVPQVAQIMPSTAPAAQQENREPPTVLKPEDLQFQDTLQGKKPQETVTVDSAKKPADAPGAPGLQGGSAPVSSLAPAAGSAGAAVPTTSLEKTPAPLPKGQVATSPAQPDRKTPKADPAKPADPKDAKDAKAAKDSKDSKAAKDAKDTKSPKIQATYQIAALDKQSQAQAEVDRLAKKGVKASVEEAKVDGKSLYRVIVQVKGTEAEIKQTLEKAGAKKPILRDKKSL
ncbi:SPOR domain-containing protein [Fundidesulfovibrio putealis]|uniref:SPOR domain-containing protein n=1 Tax=Fundidesulfovibrio putealis TaxID=270496 RepID=UPI0003FBD1C5|nr:SPOR domain-containing protein [Fundidesulfovibrio putealis]